jgi:hypothetical protein
MTQVGEAMEDKLAKLRLAALAAAQPVSKVAEVFGG